MTLKEKLDGYDSLTLVHADFVSARIIPNKYYLHNLRTATQKMKEMGREVFFLPSGHIRYESLFQRLVDYIKTQICSVGGYIPKDLFSQWEHIPKELIKSRDFQGQVDYIAKKIGKSNSEVNLAAGGMGGKACVKTWLKYCCGEVQTNFNDHLETERQRRIEKPFASGWVLNELTDGGGMKQFK